MLYKNPQSKIAQLVEQVTVNHWVVGSSPTLGGVVSLLLLVCNRRLTFVHNNYTIMAITAAAKKAAKRSLKLRARNAQFKFSMKQAIKALRKASENADAKKEMPALLQKAYSAIDRAQKRNIIHKKNASNKKSKLAKLVVA